MADLAVHGYQVRHGVIAVPGGVPGTLDLIGGGEFRLDLATSISNVGTITVQEGQGAAEPTLWLRPGTSFTIDVASASAGQPAGGIVFVGAANSDVVTLGTGLDFVYVGGPNETFIGGGHDTFFVNAATIGARIDGGLDHGTTLSELAVGGGGTESMGANVTNVAVVHLQGGVFGTAGFNFTANNIANLLIASSRGNDVIHVGAASQVVYAGGQYTTVDATADLAGVQVGAYAPGSSVTLNISGGGVGVLNDADKPGSFINIADSMILDLGHAGFLNVTAQAGGNAITAQQAYQTINVTHGGDQLFASLAHKDTFAGTAAALQSANIHNFARTDLLHVTDLSATAAFSYSAIGGNEDRVHIGASTLTLVNIAPTAQLTRTDDGNGGSYIRVV